MTQEYLKSIMHYDPTTGVFIWLRTKGKQIKGNILGSKNGKGYLQVGIDTKRYRLHRLAWLYMEGYIPDQVDHYNQTKEDNSWLNLRPSDSSHNMKNKTKYNNNTSDTTGVSLNKNTNKWCAYIYIDGVKKSLGAAFSSKREAIEARLIANKKHGFSKNHGKVKV